MARKTSTELFFFANDSQAAKKQSTVKKLMAFFEKYLGLL